MFKFIKNSIFLGMSPIIEPVWTFWFKHTRKRPWTFHYKLLHFDAYNSFFIAFGLYIFFLFSGSSV